MSSASDNASIGSTSAGTLGATLRAGVASSDELSGMGSLRVMDSQRWIQLSLGLMGYTKLMATLKHPDHFLQVVISPCYVDVI